MCNFELIQLRIENCKIEKKRDSLFTKAVLEQLSFASVDLG